MSRGGTRGHAMAGWHARSRVGVDAVAAAGGEAGCGLRDFGGGLHEVDGGVAVGALLVHRELGDADTDGVLGGAAGEGAAGGRVDVHEGVIGWMGGGAEDGGAVVWGGRWDRRTFVPPTVALDGRWFGDVSSVVCELPEDTDRPELRSAARVAPVARVARQGSRPARS